MNYHLTTTSFIDCTEDCNNCTLTCERIYIHHRPIKICSYTSLPAPKPPEKIFTDPPDYELIKLRRKHIYQRSNNKSIYFSKPLYKRKLMVSVSGWLTRGGYKKKKGYNKKS